MRYHIIVTPRAHKSFRRMSRDILVRVSHAIDALETDPRPPGSRKLQGFNLWRIKIGDYRVIYRIEDERLVVTVVNAGHRSSIYRDL